MILFYVRHGDPTYDPDELTPLGHRQAEAIGRRLARYGLDEIYVSSAVRAIETSLPTREMLKMDATILDWTNESHAWEQMSLPDGKGGRTWGFARQDIKELFTSKEIKDLGEMWYTHPYLQDTTIPEGYLRIKNLTREFLASQGYVWEEEKGRYRNDVPNDKRIALFAHHGFGVTFLSSVLDIPYPQICEKFNFSHSGLTVINFQPENGYVIPQVLTLGNDGHLLMEGLPTKYNNQLYF